MKISILKMSVLFLLMAALPDTAFSQPLEVYLFGGQSNQQGLGEYDELTEEQCQPLANSLFWTDGKFIEIHPGETQTSAVRGRFGPEIGFAIAHADGGRDAAIAIIKHPRSGTALSSGWDDQVWRGSTTAPGRPNFYPGESADDPHKGTAYIDMVNRYKEGFKHLEDQGISYTIKGFIWVQGEQDSKNETSASQYAVNLSRLIDRLHQDLGIVDKRVPFLFAQSLGIPPSGLIPGTGPDGESPNRFVYRELLRKTMMNADEGSQHDQAVDGAYIVSTDGLPLIDDVHYNTPGQLELGQRFYAEFERRQQDSSP